jgi:hypothetical protein
MVFQFQRVYDPFRQNRKFCLKFPIIFHPIVVLYIQRLWSYNLSLGGQYRKEKMFDMCLWVLNKLMNNQF